MKNSYWSKKPFQLTQNKLSVIITFNIIIRDRQKGVDTRYLKLHII